MRIGVFCSGGDSPGMNACIRAVVRTAVPDGHEVVGIYRGYTGLLNEDFWINPQGEATMGLRCVSNISKFGGTILHSSRCKEFRADEGVKRAADILRKHEIDALIPIGGNGTLRGATELARFWDGRIIGCPGTIDNDLEGSDYTIGFATAVSTSVDALDKLRDTAESHERLFIVEVMGRHSGYIGLYTALAGGAEVAAIPETKTDVNAIVKHLKVLKARGKHSIMIVVAEGDENGGAAILNEELQKADCPFATRVLLLGHLQRGGSPVPDDRILATRLGHDAVRAVVAGETGKMAGIINGQSALTPLEETYKRHRPIPDSFIKLLNVMSN